MRLERTGFTLVEVLLSAIILSCGLAVIVKGMAVALDGSRHAGAVYQAATILERKAEDVFIHASLDGGLKAGLSEGEEETSYGPFRWKLEAEPDDGALAAVTATITWAEGGRPRSLADRFYVEKMEDL